MPGRCTRRLELGSSRPENARIQKDLLQNVVESDVSRLRPKPHLAIRNSRNPKTVEPKALNPQRTPFKESFREPFKEPPFREPFKESFRDPKPFQESFQEPQNPGLPFVQRAFEAVGHGKASLHLVEAFGGSFEGIYKVEKGFYCCEGLWGFGGFGV